MEVKMLAYTIVVSLVIIVCDVLPKARPGGIG